MKNFIALDLELNQLEKPKIIQIGCVAFSLEPFQILEELSLIINPKEQLLERIITLTGITQAQVDSGLDLQIAYGKLCELKVKYSCESYPVVWGHGDSEALRKEVYEGGNQSQFIFGRRSFDAKTLYQTYRLSNGLKTQSGLKKSCHNMDITFKGPAHDALNDARATALIFKKLTDLYKQNEKT